MRLAFAVSLVLLAAVPLVGGCHSVETKPIAGPLPLTGPKLSLTRHERVERKFKLGTITTVKWAGSDGFRRPPEAFTGKLRPLLPPELVEAAGYDDEQEEVASVNVAVVSLRPDVHIVTVTRRKQGKDNSRPFAGFNPQVVGSPFHEDDPDATPGVEQFDREADRLIYYTTGSVLPYAEEMFVIADGLPFDGDRVVFPDDDPVVELPTDAYVIRLAKTGGLVNVSSVPPTEQP